MATKRTTASEKPEPKGGEAKRPETKAPTHYAYSVREARKEGEKGFWTRIGAYWAHEDGEGGTLKLDAFPLDGKVVIRAPKPEDA